MPQMPSIPGDKPFGMNCHLSHHALVCLSVHVAHSCGYIDKVEVCAVVAAMQASQKFKVFHRYPLVSAILKIMEGFL